MSLWILQMIEEQFHRDADDRPLRESRTPAAHLRPDDLQHRTCPYAGSRFQHARPMNVAALRQTSTHWSDLVDALALVRTLHAEQRGDGPPDLMDVWRTSQLAAALPWFYILRSEGRERAPGFAAALAKATQGVGVWAQELLAETLARGDAIPTLTAAKILASAEATGALIGEVEVCAGSEAMLRRFFETLVAGAPALTTAPLVRLAAERAEVLRFGAHYANLKLLLWLHALARQFVYADLIAALGPTHALAPAVRGLADDGCEPSDFVMIGPPEPAAVPRASRAAWLTGLAGLVVPLAPDGSDAALVTAALALAHVSGADGPAAERDALAAEVMAVTGVAAAPAALAASALATFARLDAILGAVAATVEAGFRGTVGAAAPARAFDAAARDRLQASPPRAVFARLAPVELPARCPP
ncbi:MAG: hypothetical protein IPL61_30505 [Myxococcales bacterium]|nr:hypothetical protein [Myxococcales bacterium]